MCTYVSTASLVLIRGSFPPAWTRASSVYLLRYPISLALRSGIGFHTLSRPKQISSIVQIHTCSAPAVRGGNHRCAAKLCTYIFLFQERRPNMYARMPGWGGLDETRAYPSNPVVADHFLEPRESRMNSILELAFCATGAPPEGSKCPTQQGQQDPVTCCLGWCGAVGKNTARSWRHEMLNA